MGLADILFSMGEAILRELDRKTTGGKIFDVVDNQIDKMQDKCDKQLDEIEKYKRSLQSYSDKKLVEICRDSNCIKEKRIAAMEILTEKGLI